MKFLFLERDVELVSFVCYFNDDFIDIYFIKILYRECGSCFYDKNFN